jgi:hypothetical protein
VHTGKFTAERRTERIRRACDRLGIKHPVVNDRHYRIWRSFAINAWPSIALVDTRGHLIGIEPGEFDVESVATVIEHASERASVEGTLNRRVLDFGSDPRALLPRDSALRYPGRSIAREDHLFIADSGNSRVLEAEMHGEFTAQILRTWTLADGDTGSPFVEPIGLAISDDALFVADRAGQRVSSIDLTHGAAATIAGTGTLGSGGTATSDLRSPWDIELIEPDTLLIAMSGSHQLMTLSPSSGELTLAAGSGAEGIHDGQALEAMLAQPTGLALSRDRVVFCDSESSAVRTYDPVTDQVSTIVGSGLFDFGDVDGQGEAVRLQHPLDVTVLDGLLYVLDSYNDRIKIVDPARKSVRTMPGPAGTGKALTEPMGVSSFGGKLLIADTGAHRLVLVGTDGHIEPIEIVQ